MRTLRMLGALTCAAGALALPAGAPANVQVGSSGWRWGNPLPQGNAIRALSFAGAQGYAAGDFGTLLRTTDAGASWTGLLSGTFTGLTEVQAIDADSLFAGGGCVARRSDDGGATFTRVAFTPVESSCREQLAAGWFVTEATGYLVLTDGTTLRTDNSGDTFAQKNPLPGTRAPGGSAEPTDVVFTGDTTGVGATSDGKLHRTTDGANSWALVNDTNRAVRGFSFVDASTGFAVGDASLFLTTRDGGATWVARDLGIAPTDLRSIRCATDRLCVIATDKGDQVVCTGDGGATARLIAPSPGPIFAAAFASPTRIVAGGATGATAISDDAGLTYAPVGGRLTGTFNRVRAGLQGGSAFAPGDDGTLAKTTDGGRSWSRGNVSTSEDVLDVSFPSASTGFALDTAGGLFRTNDGGGTWKSLDTGTTARPNAVYATSASTVLLVGPTGLRRSSDGGGTFDAVRGTAVRRAGLTGADRAAGAVFAYGPRSLVRSTDGGRTWRSLPKPGQSRRSKGKAAQQVDFVTARTGFFLAADGAVYRTRNAGRSWTRLNGVGTHEAYGLAFSSATRGYLVIDSFGDVADRSGFLLRTTDGGSTWHPQFVVSSPIQPLGIAAAPGGTDYLLGGESSLLYSTTGGDAGRAGELSITTKRRKLRRATRITVTGRLSPARGSERVTVSHLPPGRTVWRHQTVKVAANGAYTTSWDLRRGTSTFVAQWPGDFRSRGDGSPTLAVKVGR